MEPSDYEKELGNLTSQEWREMCLNNKWVEPEEELLTPDEYERRAERHRRGLKLDAAMANLRRPPTLSDEV